MIGSDDAAYLVAGRDTGFSEDFDHPGVVVARAAAAELWPRVIAWLEARAPAAPGGLHGG